MRRPVVVVVVTGGAAADRLAVPRREVGQRRLPGAARGRAGSRRRREADTTSAPRGRPPRCWSGAGRGRGGGVHRALAAVAGSSTSGRSPRGRRHAAAGRLGGQQPDRHSQAIVTEIRDDRPASGTSLVGGLSRRHRRPGRLIGAHLPWMGLIVVGVMLVLLFIAFGSLVLPLKAVVMNVISITAAFGVVTWIFSDGHLAGLLGFTPPGFLDATKPILMLAILFGLSMDYEVFLLSRIREQWDRTDDNDLAVVTGVQKTGRIITSAAAAAGRRDRGVRAHRHRVHEDARHRHARRPAHRRDRGPRAAGARDDEAARATGTGGRPARCCAGGSDMASARATTPARENPPALPSRPASRGSGHLRSLDRASYDAQP